MERYGLMPLAMYLVQTMDDDKSLTAIMHKPFPRNFYKSFSKGLRTLSL